MVARSELCAQTPHVFLVFCDPRIHLFFGKPARLWKWRVLRGRLPEQEAEQLPLLCRREQGHCFFDLRQSHSSFVSFAFFVDKRSASLPAPHLLLLLLAFRLQPPHVAGELLLQLGDLLVFAGGGGFGDLACRKTSRSAIFERESDSISAISVFCASVSLVAGDRFSSRSMASS